MSEELHVSDLKELFQKWKRKQDEEVEKIEEQIKVELESRGQTCVQHAEGDIFQEKCYAGKENTISSHFCQFFYKQCTSCDKLKEKSKDVKYWKHVLTNSFHMDGTVGTWEIPKEGYEYIFLLKEANDSSKKCVSAYPEFKLESNKINEWLLDWRENKKSASMLNKLCEACGYVQEVQNAETEKCYLRQEFTNRIAYMNVNKRGGREKTQGKDETAVIKYAETYKTYIFEEIKLLAGNKEEIVVYVAGSKDYFRKLMKAFDIQKQTFQYKELTIRFVHIFHPASRVSAKCIKEQMEFINK